jgi:hypothetical protein
MAAELLPYAVLGGLLLLGAYIYYLASRSREAELKQALRKCEIALQDAEHSLQGASRLHGEEIRRLKADRRRSSNKFGPTGEITQFRDAKSAFARLFHPDAAGGDDGERELRAEIFKEYWEELERIERRD